MRAVALAVACALGAQAQSFSQRGFLETRNYLYWEKAPNDSGLAVSEELLRWEPAWKPRKWIQINASFDARFDSHRQFERAWRLDWADRSIQRPAFSARRLSAILNKGGLTVEAGRQFIRWGKTDILNPTDRFAPRDFLNVVNTDFLGVTALRLTYEKGANTLDAVWQPVFTPSRAPLLDQRWVVLPEQVQGYPILDQGSRIPGGGQYGLRWNHVGSGYELGAAFYEGHNHLPLLDAGFWLAPGLTITIERYYAQMRMYGGDVVVPLRWFTVKGEAGYFTSSTKTADEYALWVVQLERMSGEWLLVGGYAGEGVTRRRSLLDFAPDRGLANTILGRASYNLDANRSVAFEGAVRQNGDGMYGKLEYTQAMGSHWRLTGALTLIGGKESDFLGQYHRNSHFMLVLRYNF